MKQINNQKSNAILKYIASEIAADDMEENQQIRDELKSIEIPGFVKEDFEKIYSGSLIEERRKQRKKKLMALSRTAAIIALAVTVTFTVLVTSVDAFRAAVFEFFVHESERSKEITPYKSGEEGKLIQEQRGYYSAEYIPTGYVVTESNELDDYMIFLYENEDGGWISISQQPLENRTFSLNNEVDDSGEILINNEKALWSIKEGIVTIFWMHSSTAITISAEDVSFDELIKIAENIIFKK